MLRKNQSKFGMVPIPDFKRTPFQRTVLKKVVQSVIDSLGNKVSERKCNVSVCEIIPQDEFFNPSVTADMFSIENLQASGIELRRVTTPLFTATPDEKAAFVQHVEGFDFDSLLDVLPSEPSPAPSATPIVESDNTE